MKKDSSILVTGGAGFVGTHLCRRLTQAGQKVTSLDLREPKTAVPGVHYVQGDVRDEVLLAGLVAAAQCVYHLAATVSVPICQNDPVDSYSNNLMATIGVLEAIRRRPIPLVFASTAALYGSKGDDGRALSESDTAPEFSSFYAAQKHASEKAIELYSACYGIPATVFRFFNIFGPGQDPTSPYSGVITVFMNRAKSASPLPLNGGGHQTRDFISVHDIVSACVSVLELPLEKWNPAPMNLGTGKTITIRELAEMISRAHGGRSEITIAPARDGDVTHSLADIRRARQNIGFEPKHSLSDGLTEI